MFVQCVPLTNKGHRGVEAAAAERVHLLYKFHNIDRECAQTAPQTLVVAKHSNHKWW